MNSQSGSPVGHVSEASGTVVAIASDGSQRILEPGDAVYENEQVVTQTGGSAVIKLTNNQVVSVSGDSSVQLDAAFMQASVSESESEDTEESAEEKVADIQEQIKDGADPSDVADPSSAGESSDTDQPVEPESGGLKPETIVIEHIEAVEDEVSLVEEVTEVDAPVYESKANFVEAAKDTFQNYIPVAQSSSAKLTEDGTVLEGQLQATDANAGEELRFHLIAGPDAGELTLNQDGSFQFEPGDDFQYLGADEQTSVAFSFEVRDTAGNSSRASVDIAITGINDTPEVSESVEAGAGQNSDIFSVNLLEHAADVDISDSINVDHIRLMSGNEVGVSLSLDGNELVIDPQAYEYLAEGEFETIGYEYRVTDSQGAYTLQTAEIVLAGQNDLPVVSNAVVYSGDQDVASFSINLLEGASDVDATDTLNVVSLQLVAGDPVGISVAPDGNALELDSSAYAALAEGETEEIEYQYTVDDGHGGQVDQTATITIDGVNDAPVSSDSQFTTSEDTAYTFSLNDFPYSDIDNGDQLESVQITRLPAHGSLTLNGQSIANGQDIPRTDLENGLFQFQPDGNESGDNYADFTFRVSDGDLLSQEHSFAVDVTPVADTPELTISGLDADPDGSYSISSLEDTPIPLNVLQSLSDNDGSESLSLMVSGAPLGSTITDGTNSVAATGGDIDLTGWQLSTLQLIPEDNANADFDLTFTATSTELANGDQAVSSVVLHVDMVPVNDRPESIDATATINEDTTYIFALSDFAFTDVDAGSSLQNIQITSLPVAGSLLYNDSPVAADLEVSRTDLITGRLKFEPAPDTNGNDYAQFDFRVSDGELYSEAQSFGFNVTAINDAPDIGAAVIETAVEDSALTSIDLLQHASDVDAGDVLSVSELTLDSGNAVGVTSSGNSLSLRPDDYDYLPEGQTETITYSYNIVDGHGGVTPQTATITITGTNDTAEITGIDTGTLAEDDVGSLTADGNLEVTGTLTISDADTGEASFTAGTVNGTYGSVDIEADGSWSYSADNSQTDIQALQGGVDAIFTGVTATYQHSNTNKWGVAKLLDGDTGGRGWLLATAERDNGHSATLTLDGEQQVDTVDLQWYRATNNKSDTVELEYQDSNGGWQSLGIFDVNDQLSQTFDFDAVMASQLRITPQGQENYPGVSVIINEFSASSQPSLTDTITVTAVDGTPHDIVVEITGTGDVSVVSGTDTGDVTEGDSGGDAVTAMGTLSITDVDASDSPVFEATTTGVAGDNGYGTLDLNASGDWTYTLNATAAESLDAGQMVNDTVTLTASDGTTHDIVLTITGSDDIPEVTGADTGEVTEGDSGGDAVTAFGTISITDVDASDSPVFDAITGVAGDNGYGSLDLDVSGNWTYTLNATAAESLNAGQMATDTVTLTASDGTAHDIVVEITGSNDGPTAAAITNQTATEDTLFTFTVPESAFGDVDSGDTLTYSVTLGDDSALPDWLSFDAGSKTVSGTPTNDHADSTITLKVTATDTSGASATNTFDVAITGTNDAPTAADDTLFIDEDGSHIFSAGDFGFDDVDAGDSLESVTLTQLPDAGTLALNDVAVTAGQVIAAADINSLIFTPVADANGDSYASLKFTVSDGDASSAPQTLTFNVTSVNDAPEAQDDLVSVTDTDTASGSLVANDSDTENDPLSVTMVNGQAVAATGTTSIEGDFGTLDIAADGSWDYVLSADKMTGDLDSDLVGQWSFDESTGTTAADSAPDDAQSTTGQLNGDAAFVAGGISGNAVQLDGDGDRVIIGDSTELNLYDDSLAERTTGLFFRIDPDNDLSGTQMLYENSSHTKGFNIYIQDGQLYAGGWSVNEGWDGTWVSTSLADIDADSANPGWHHVAMVLDANESTLKLYLDGTEHQSDYGEAVKRFGDDGAFGGLNNLSLLHTGDSVDSDNVGTLSFHGQIDEARIYNRALTDNEVSLLSRDGSDGSDLTDSFSYTLSDGELNSTATLTLDVTGANFAPTAADETLTIDEDGSHSFIADDFGFNDADTGDSLESVTITTLPAVGTLTLDGEAVTANQVIPEADIVNLLYAPGADDNGDGYASLQFTVSDGVAGSAQQTLTFNVTAINDAPVADTITNSGATQDSEFSFTLPQSSFTDVDTGDTLTYIATLDNGDDLPAWLSFDAATRTFSGTPGNDDVGNITLRVTATDTSDESATSNFTITVTNTNDVPVADVFTASFNEDDAAITGQLTATDADGDSITYAVDQQPANASDGTVSIDADGQFTLSGYDFNALDDGASKEVTFTYTADDGRGAGVGTNTVTLTITGSNDVPVVSEAVILNALAEDVTVSVTSDELLANAQDADTSSVLIVTSLTADNGATVTPTASGWDIQPAADFNGLLTLSYDVSDGTAITPATATISVDAVNDAPVVVNSNANTLTEESVAAGDVVATFSASDVDGDTLSYSLTGGNDSGFFDIDSSSGQVTLTQTGVDAINSDEGVDLTSMTLTAIASDETLSTPPMSADVSITRVNDNAPVISGLTTEQVSEEGVSVTFSSATATHQASSSRAGSKAIDGNDGENNYWSCPADTISAQPQLTVVLNGSQTLTSLSVDFYTSSNGIYRADQIEVEYKNSEGSWVGHASHATTAEEINTLSFLPVTTDEIRLTIIGNSNSPNGAVAINEITAHNTGATGDLVASDPDDGSTTTFTPMVDEAGTYGTLNLDADGHWTYVLDDALAQSLATGASYTEMFTVTAVDEDGNPSSETLEVAVNGLNDAPEAADKTLIIDEDGRHTFQMTDFGFDDVDAGDSLESVTLTQLPDAGTLTLNDVAVTAGQVIAAADINSLIFTPAADANGDSYTSLQFTVSDGDASSAEQTLTFDVTAVSDAAVISGDDQSAVTEDSATVLTTFGALTVTDQDSGEAGFTAATVPGSYGNLTIDADGSWSYSADNTQTAIQSLGDGGNVTETIEVQSVDGTTHSIVITINGTNDAPTIEQAATEQLATEEAAFTYTLPAGAFADQEGDVVTLSATLADDNPLPAWLSFDALSGTFSGTPDDADLGTLSVKVTATDGSDNTEMFFGLTIEGVNDVPVSGDVDLDNTNEDTAIVITEATLLANASDADGDSLSVASLTVDDSAQGALVDNGDSTWTFTPATNFNGDDVAFSFTVSDGVAGSEVTATATLDVLAVNDAAVISGIDSASIDEDSAATPTASGALTITDADAGEASFTAETAPGTYGTLTIDESGSWSYDLDNSNGAVQALKGGGEADFTEATATFVHTSGSWDPDNLTGDGTGNGWLVTTAEMSNNPSVDLSLDSQTSVDTVDITWYPKGDGRFYRSDEVGIEYQDENGDWQPVGVFDALEQSVQTITFDAIVTDKLRISPIGNTAHSTWNVAISDIAASSTPGSLTDTVQVTALDGTTHDIVVEITGSNDGPTAAAITDQTATEDALFTFTVPESAFSDVDSGDTLAYSVTLGDDSALPDWLSFDAGSKTVSGTPTNDHVDSTITLKVTATDTAGASATNTFDVSITGTNDAPTAADDTLIIDEDGSHSFIADDFGFSDADTGDSLESVTITTLPAVGTLTLGGEAVTANQVIPEADIVNLVYAPGADDSGDGYASLQFTVSDGEQSSATQTLTFNVTGVSDSAIIGGTDTGTLAEDDAGSLTAGGELEVSGTLTISDADTGEASFTAETVNGYYGSVTIDPNGSWTYSADNSQSDIQTLGDGGDLTDSIQVQSIDGTTHNIEILITGTNDDPVASVIADQPAVEDIQFSFTVPGDTFSDIDTGDALTYSATLDDGSALPSWLSFEAATRTFSGTPGNDDSGSIVLKVTATDGTGASASSSFNVTIDNTNDAPTVQDSTLTLNEDGSYPFTENDFGFNDIDTGDSLESVTITQLPAVGALTLDGIAVAANDVIIADDIVKLAYTPAADDNGDGYASLEFTVSDGEASSAPQTLTFNVTGINDSAIIGGTDTGSLTEDDAGILEVSGTLTISDIDTGEASFTATTFNGTYGSVAIEADGSWTYSADNSQAEIQALQGPVGVTLTGVTATYQHPDTDRWGVHKLIDDLDGGRGWLIPNAERGNNHSATLTLDGEQRVDTVDLQWYQATNNKSDTVELEYQDSNDDWQSLGSFEVNDQLSQTFNFDAVMASQLRITPQGQENYPESGIVINEFRASSQLTLTDTVTVTAVDGTTHDIVLTMTGGNDAPIVSEAVTLNAIAEDGTLSVTSDELLANTQDADASSVLVVTSLTADNGATVTATASGWDIQPAANFSGVLTLNYEVSDGTVTTSATAVVMVSNVNSAPEAEDNVLILNEDGSHTFEVDQFGFSDIDGDSLQSITITQLPALGSLTLNGVAVTVNDVIIADDIVNLAYTPAADGNGDGYGSLEFTVSDGEADSAPQTLTFNVTGVNDSAVIGGTDTGSLREDDVNSLNADGKLEVSGILTISDADTGEASFTAETVNGDYGSVIIAANGSWTYSADNAQPAIQALNGDISFSGVAATYVHNNDDQWHPNNLIDGKTEASDGGWLLTIAEMNNNPSVELSIDSTQPINTVNFQWGMKDEARAYRSDNVGIEYQDENGDWQSIGIFEAEHQEVQIFTFDDVETDKLRISPIGHDDRPNWNVVVREISASYDQLEPDTLTDTIQVTALDGTTHDIVVEITGTSDASDVSGTFTGAVTEGDSGGDAITVDGTISITDVDMTPNTAFAAISGVVGDEGYGSLDLDDSGSWTYTLDATAAESLNAGEVVYDTVTLTASNGTTQDIVLTITGTNDAPDVQDKQVSLTATDTTSGSLITEDSDIDSNDVVSLTMVNGQAVAATGTTSIEGDFGTLDIAADGSWDYELSGDKMNGDLDSDLVGQWSFDESSGTLAADSAPNDAEAADGELKSHATFVADGVSGNALELDGNWDRVLITDSSEINDYSDTLAERTTGLFFKIDPANDLSGTQVLYESGGGSNGFNIYIQEGELYAGAWSESTGWDGAWVGTSLGNIDMDPDNPGWHHVALVLDSNEGTLKLYLDGTEQQSGVGEGVGSHGDSTIGGLQNNTSTLLHSAEVINGSAGNSFHGQIDEARIYNRALTDNEVSLLSSEGSDLTDSFSYTLSDGDLSSTASLTLDLTEASFAPALRTANIEGNTLTINLSKMLNSNAVIDPGLFSVTVEGTTKAISAASINGKQLVLTLTEAVADGEQVSLSYTPPADSTLLDNDRVEDAEGYDLIATTDLTVTNTTNSGGAPAVVKVFSDEADQWYVDGDVITIKVQFSERVEVNGLPTLQLETGISDSLATYDSGSGTDTLLFTYNVVTPDSVADLDILSSDSLSLNGGIITDMLGNNALLTLPEPGSENSLAGSSEIQVSAVSPLIAVTDSENFLINEVISLSGAGFESLLSAGEANTTDLTGQLDWSKLEWHVVDEAGNDTTVTFSSDDIASVQVISDATLNIRLTSGKLESLASMTGFGNDGSSDYLTVATGGFFANTAGNSADFSSSLIEVASLASDGVAPAVSSISSTTPDGEYAAGSTLQFSVDFDATVIVTGEPVLLLETGDKVHTARYVSGSDTGSLTFEYQVQDGDTSADLDVYGTSALRLNGGSIVGLYGNEAQLTVPVATDSNSLASQSDIIIDGEAPGVTFASAALTEEGADGWKLTLSGDNFETMIATGQELNPSLTLSGDDLDNHFDWSKLELNLKQPDDSFSSLDITAEAISEVQVYEDRLEIVLDEGAGLITDNAGLSSFSGDVRIAVNSGFISDAPGNVASTDTLAETDVAVTTSGATIDHITADTPDGTYGIGDEIVIRVTFSEVVELQNYDGNSDPLILLLDDRLPDGQNPVGGNAVYESGSGTRELVFRHTISEGENINDLNYRSTDALSFASDLGFATPAGSSLVNGSSTTVSLTLAALDSTDALAGSSDIEVDTIVPTAAITGAAWDEGNNQLLIQGSDFETLLTSTESTTVDLTSRLDWSKITIDIDKDDGVTQDITLTADDVVSAKLAGNETITITLTDAKASELEGILGYGGAEDGVDITQGFLLDPSGNMTAQADIADLTLDYSDLTSPLVTRVSLATPGHFKSGDEVTIQVEMSEVVNITGINASDDSTKPTLALNNGTTAIYTGGSGTSVLLFSYTVAADAGENIDSLNYASTDALTIPAGLTISDGSGNSALTTLPDIDSNDALGQSSLGVIDISGPSVSSVDAITPDGAYKEGGLIQIEVGFDEMVEVEGQPLLNLNEPGVTATYTSGSGTDTLVFNLTVPAGANIDSLDVDSASPFDLTNASIQDLAGNDLLTTSTPTGSNTQSLASQSDIVIDTTIPEFDFQETSFAIRPQKEGSSFPALMVLLVDGNKVVEAEYDPNPVRGTSDPIENADLINWNKIYLEYTDDHFNRQKLYLSDDVVELVYGSTRHTLVSISIDLDYVIENGALSTWDYNTTGDAAQPDEDGHNPNNDGVTGFHTTFVMESGALPDAAGNFNDTAIVKDLNNFYDRTDNAHWTDTQSGAAVSGAELLRSLIMPEVTKVSFANTENQFYQEGDEITINVHYNQVMRVRTHDDWPELQLSNGATATFDTSTLNSREAHDGADNTAFAGRVLKFTYTVQAGDDISTLGLDGVSPQINLNGAFIEHGYGLHQLNDNTGVDRDDPTSGDWDRTADLSLPAEGDENSLSAQMDVAISTTPPAATVTDTHYDSATGLLKINGSGFEGILVGSTTVECIDLKPLLDWSKLTYKVNGTDTLTFTEDDIASAGILDDGSILIQLSSVKMEAIAALTAGDVGDDLVDIAAGLVRDLAGNVSTTDGITDATVTAADLKAPELDQAMASGNDLALVFNEALAGTPDASEFTVRVNGAERTLTTIDVTDKTATLTFDGAAVTDSDQVIFDYNGSSLADGDGNSAATISDGVAGYSHSTTAGMETLLGDIGDDIFTIDHDDASVTGGSGADTIHLNILGSANDVADLTITDFHADEGDKLVLDDLIVDSGNSLDEYLHFTTDGNDTVMEVSSQAGGDVSQRVTFKDVDLFSLGGTDSDIINNLLDNGNIDHGQ